MSRKEVPSARNRITNLGRRGGMEEGLPWNASLPEPWVQRAWGKQTSVSLLVL